MSNPWADLPDTRPYILPQDKSVLARFQPRRPEAAIRTEVLPEPFVGNPEAPVLLLGLNPGFSDDDVRIHRGQKFAQTLRKNLIHAPLLYPFYFLDPELPSPGQDWWKRRLRSLEEAVGVESVAAGLCCIEYFPYHSARFSRALPIVPSQAYGFHLVRKAIARRAAVVIMRSFDLWTRAVPELVSYQHCFRLRSPQNVAVSPKNCPEGYPQILQRLRRQ